MGSEGGRAGGRERVSEGGRERGTGLPSGIINVLFIGVLCVISTWYNLSKSSTPQSPASYPHVNTLHELSQ